MRVVLCSICDKVIEGTSRVVVTKKMGGNILSETISEPNSDQIVLTECLQCKKD